MIKRITEAFHLHVGAYLILSLLTSSFKLKPIHWFRHLFCIHVAYIPYYKHYQAYLKYLRVGPIDTRPICFRFNKTESILVIYLIREPLPLVGNETDSSVESGDLVLCLQGDQSVIGLGPRSYSGVCIYSYYEGRNLYSVC